jgi:hypothetical protein
MPRSLHAATLFAAAFAAGATAFLGYAVSDPLPPDTTYRPLPLSSL